MRLIYFGSRRLAGLHPRIKTFRRTSAIALPLDSTAGSMPTETLLGVATIANARLERVPDILVRPPGW